MNQENGKGIIFGILGILTLIIAIMGASLAYFTANATSGEEPIEVTAATVTISYIQGTNLQLEEGLIPSSMDVVDWAYNRTAVDDEGPLQCKDAKGYAVCSVFRFDVSNEQGRNDQRIEGKITTNTDLAAAEQSEEFENLSYTIYDVTDEEAPRKKINPYLTKLSKVGGEPTQIFNDGLEEENSNTYVIKAGERRKFEIVIWLNEKSTEYSEEELEADPNLGRQDDEQGLSYSGIVEIGVSNASGHITGTMGED